MLVRNPQDAEKDTPTLLAHAAEQARARRYEDFLIVDVDCHHYENASFPEIAAYIEDPVIRQNARAQGMGTQGFTSPEGSYQEMNGRIGRVRDRFTEKTPSSPHRDITLSLRWMDALGVDIACLFPTPMLGLAQLPRHDVELALARAYNRWLVENVLAHEPRIRAMLYLPFNQPEACYAMVEEFGDRPGVLGFMVTATHQRAVYDNAYMKTYAALEERNLPLAFHGSFIWGRENNFALANRFITVHALGFTFYNMLHISNWIMNALPERFPKLKLIWIESGLAWLPFLMQRLDNEFMSRTSECPGLKRRPSEYMREMYYTSQPMERVDNAEALPLTFKMMNASTQLLYSSDYPHWDMDLPSTIYDLPFIDETTKRNILGENARRLFNLEPVFGEQKLLRRAERALRKTL